MKAPNGKKTKLTEKQWVQFRTRAFKKWFGDWENDAANASKVVDEKGEPRVVFKRMASEINEFNTDFGAFFSNEAIDDLSFGDCVGNYYLNIKNPLILDANGSSWSYPMWLYLANENDVIPETTEEYERIIKERNLLNLVPKEIWDIVWKSEEEYDFEDAVNLIKKFNLPYNGAIVKNIGEGAAGMQVMDDYIAMQPTQIKSATDNIGTFDEGNNDIRFRVSGDPFYSNAERAVEDPKFCLTPLTP